MGWVHWLVDPWVIPASETARKIFHISIPLQPKQGYTNMPQVFSSPISRNSFSDASEEAITIFFFHLSYQMSVNKKESRFFSPSILYAFVHPFTRLSRVVLFFLM